MLSSLKPNQNNLTVLVNILNVQYRRTSKGEPHTLLHIQDERGDMNLHAIGPHAIQLRSLTIGTLVLFCNVHTNVENEEISLIAPAETYVFDGT